MVKPNVFIVGAAKCGTTTLYEYLNIHPEVFMCPVKEPHFFSDIESTTPFDYVEPIHGEKYHNKIIRSVEVYSSLFKDAAAYKIRGEASVSYMLDLNSAERIFTFNPEAKIVAIIRNPIDRVFSHFRANCMVGSALYPDDFYKEITEDWSLTGKKWGVKGHLYLEMGFYTEQLEKYYRLFPREKILVLAFNDLKNDTEKTIRKLYNFLGVNENVPFQNEKVHNETKKIKNGILLKIKKAKERSIFLHKFSRKLPIWLKTHFYTSNFDKVTMDKDVKHFLQNIYKDEIEKIKTLYGIQL